MVIRKRGRKKGFRHSPTTKRKIKRKLIGNKNAKKRRR